MAFTIRQFQKEDMAGVLELANKYAAFDGTTSEEGLATNFPGGFWVAEDDGRLVGFVHGRIRDVPPEEGSEEEESCANVYARGKPVLFDQRWLISARVTLGLG